MTETHREHGVALLVVHPGRGVEPADTVWRRCLHKHHQWPELCCSQQLEGLGKKREGEREERGERRERQRKRERERERRKINITTSKHIQFVLLHKQIYPKFLRRKLLGTAFKYQNKIFPPVFLHSGSIKTVRQPTCTAPTGCISPIHLRVDVHDAHLATLNHVLDGVRLDPVQMLLVFPELNELVPHDLSPHVVLLDKVETVGVLIRVCLPCRVWGGATQGRGGGFTVYIHTNVCIICFILDLCPHCVLIE